MTKLFIAAFLGSLLVAGCGGGRGGSAVSGAGGSTAASSYAIGGSVSGLTGSGLVLQDNGDDDLSLAASGSFTFSTAVASGAAYVVTVKTQPSSPTQVCTVSNGTGTVGSSKIANVSVNCTVATFTIGGTVSGLMGSGVVLEDNGGNDLSIAASGSFTFSQSIASGAAYAVTVKTQPSSPTQVCAVSNGTGAVGSSNIGNVSVNCTVAAFTIGGTVSGLTGSGLVLEDNGGNDLSVAASGGFTFSQSVASGAAYAVTIKTQPSSPTQACGVTNGSGTVGPGNVSTVAVNCAPPSSCVRIVRQLLYDKVNGWTPAGAPVGFQNNGLSASFTLAGSTADYSFLAADSTLVQNSTYALRVTVSNYTGNYPGTNFLILNTTPQTFSGVNRLNFTGNGVYALVFTYTGTDAQFLSRIGINVEAGPTGGAGPGGFTISDVSLEQLPNAVAAPSSEFVMYPEAWAFNYPNLNTYDPNTGLVQEARGADCAATYKNVWAVTADSFGDDAFDFPQQLANNIERNYAFYVDAIPGRTLSTAQLNVDGLLSNTQILNQTALHNVQLPLSAATPNGLIVEGGINDIVQDTTAAQLEAVTGTIVSDVKSKHLSAILITVSPFGNSTDWTPAREQVRIAYNQWVRSQASPNDRIYVYDMAAGLSAGGIADDSNPTILAASTDAGDGLHPNEAGGLQIATGVKRILDAQPP